MQQKEEGAGTTRTGGAGEAFSHWLPPTPLTLGGLPCHQLGTFLSTHYYDATAAVASTATFSFSIFCVFFSGGIKEPRAGCKRRTTKVKDTTGLHFWFTGIPITLFEINQCGSLKPALDFVSNLHWTDDEACPNCFSFKQI